MEARSAAGSAAGAFISYHQHGAGLDALVYQQLPAILLGFHDDGRAGVHAHGIGHGGFGEIDTGDGGSQSRPGKGVVTDVALLVQERFAGDVAELVAVEFHGRADAFGIGAEAVDVVDGLCLQGDRDAIVPVG